MTQDATDHQRATTAIAAAIEQLELAPRLIDQLCTLDAELNGIGLPDDPEERFAVCGSLIALRYRLNTLSLATSRVDLALDRMVYDIIHNTIPSHEQEVPIA